MTCRGLLRLEGTRPPRWRPGILPRSGARRIPVSRFNDYYGQRKGGELPAPWNDPRLMAETRDFAPSASSGTWVGGRARLYFAFSDLAQVEAAFGPRERWPEGMAEDLREVAVLPGGVRDGDTQAVFLPEFRLF